MEQLITLKSGNFSCTVSSIGAELISVKKGERELIWQRDPAVWSGASPILFPICGGLKDDKYTYKGKEYSLPKHGFGRLVEFKFEKLSENEAVFFHSSNEETMKSYPFKHEFKVTYRLEDGVLKVDYETANTGNDTMYFSVGAHEGYSCPDGIEDYSVIFDEEEDFKINELHGNLLGLDTAPLIPKGKELKLKEEYFKIDALVFTSLKSRKVTLLNRKTESRITLSFPKHDYFLIWQKYGAKYICLEPWCGIPDFIGTGYDISEKIGIIPLEAGKTDVRSHTIDFTNA